MMATGMSLQEADATGVQPHLPPRFKHFMQSMTSIFLHEADS
jgi:hypothetical protein